MISIASPLFPHVQLIIIKVTFCFPKFVSANKRLAHFINWSLGYSRFQSYKTLKAMPIFDHHHHPKIANVTFSFQEFVSTHQKSIYFIRFSLTYSQFQSPENRVVAPIFDHAHLNIFQSTSIFRESVSICKKIRLFHYFVLEIQLI